MCECGLSYIELLFAHFFFVTTVNVLVVLLLYLFILVYYFVNFGEISLFESAMAAC